MLKKFVLPLSLSLFLLGSCGSKDNTKDQVKEIKDDVVAEEKEEKEGFTIKSPFDNFVKNEGVADKNAILKVGYVHDTPLRGIFYPLFTESVADSAKDPSIIGDLFDITEDLKLATEGGAVSFEVSDDLQKVTFTIQDGVLWHDGEQLTTADIYMAAKILAHPNYPGVRFSEPHTLITGIMDYNAGDTDEISGITIVDDLVMEFNYDAPYGFFPNNGILNYAVPEHIFKDIEINEGMLESDAIRKNPIGFGPYKIKTIVPGEAVIAEPFKDYFKGEPVNGGFEYRVVHPDIVDAAVRKGDFDIVLSYPTSTFDKENIASNVTFISDLGTVYSYMGFKLGTWSDTENKVMPNPESKMWDTKLRQAMGYALDNDSMGEIFYQGLRVTASSIITPRFTDFFDDSLEGYIYNPEKSRALLEEAGYVDIDGDGYVENPQGEELVINMAHMSGADAEDMANFYIQNLQEVGLNVRLTDGRLMEFNSFYDRVGADDPDIDIYFGAWSTGYNPDPSGLYGEIAKFNFPRYVDEESLAIQAAIASEESMFNKEILKENMIAWQQYMFNNPAAIPTLWRYEITPINNRVKNYIGKGQAAKDYFKLELTSEKPLSE